MSRLHDSSIGDFTRGGQVTIHFLRMIGQVVHKFAKAVLMLYAMVTFGLWYTASEPYSRYLGARYVAAEIGNLAGNADKTIVVERVDGTLAYTTIARFRTNETIKENAHALVILWLHSMLKSAIGSVIFLLCAFAWLFHFGRSWRKEKVLRGAEIMEAPELDDFLQKAGKASDLSLAGIPLIAGSETSHILATGSPGTGKSTLIQDLMRQIKKRGDRCICYSPSGDFIEWFAKKEDYILNPFDERCPQWNLWDEIAMPYHYDMIAAALIPPPERGDPFWTDASRQLISSIIRSMHRRGETSVGSLIRLVSEMGLDEMREYLKGTVSWRQIDPKNERTTGSIITQAVTNTMSLQYLRPAERSFNIRDWVLDEDRSEWVYLNARPDQSDSIRPLLCVWLELLTNTLMSLPPDQARRIWLVIDEVPSLHKIPSLSNFLAQARKYGGCAVLSFQQLSQLKARYGDDDALALAGLCSTWACMRQNDPETAKWVATSFGETEVIESQQGLSYGVSDMRDGVSLSTQQKKRELLLPSEIMGLDNLEGYMRLPGKFPKGHFKMKRGKIKTVSEAFIPANLDIFQSAIPMTSGAVPAGTFGLSGVPMGDDLGATEHSAVLDGLLSVTANEPATPAAVENSDAVDQSH